MEQQWYSECIQNGQSIREQTINQRCVQQLYKKQQHVQENKINIYIEKNMLYFFFLAWTNIRNKAFYNESKTAIYI